MSMIDIENFTSPGKTFRVNAAKFTAMRDAYLADPVHQAIGARIVAAAEGGIDGVFVFDVVV